MTATERIRLRMEGPPQETSEAAAVALVSALKFCAQPETFPVFLEFSRRDNAEHEWVRRVLATLDPDILTGIECMIAAGVVADFAEGGHS